MTTLLLTLLIFAIAMLVMAVGVIFKRPCLRGSCGGAGILGPDGDPLTCATCPNRDQHRADNACERDLGDGDAVTCEGDRLPIVAR